MTTNTFHTASQHKVALATLFNQGIAMAQIKRLDDSSVGLNWLCQNDEIVERSRGSVKFDDCPVKLPALEAAVLQDVPENLFPDGFGFEYHDLRISLDFLVSLLDDFHPGELVFSYGFGPNHAPRAVRVDSDTVSAHYPTGKKPSK